MYTPAAMELLPGVILTFALLVCGIVLSARRRTRSSPSRSASDRPLLLHAINDDRCTGCEACVAVCPTDVLELSQNKSRVARFNACIQCEQCVLVCPTTALVMFPRGTEPPLYKMAALDEHYRAAPRLYLIGEAAGKPLVKNASNLGRAVIEHLVREGLRPSARGGDDVDVLIVGSGPGGLSCALSCLAHRLTYALVEKDELIASTIARYPKGKHVMAEPYDVRCVGLLPVWDAEKSELLDAWKTLLDARGVRVSTRETVEDVEREGDRFAVKSSRTRYRAAAVVLAIGTRGTPRRLGVPGEALPKVAALLDDPERHAGERVLVVGGGDSAVEAAIALADHARAVTLSYRGKALSRCKAMNRQKLQALVDAGRVTLAFGTQVKEIRADEVLLSSSSDLKTLRNDHVVVCIGGEPPLKWLEKVGVRYTERPHLYQLGPTDQLVEALVGPQPENSQPDGAQRDGSQPHGSQPQNARPDSAPFGVIPQSTDDAPTVAISLFTRRRHPSSSQLTHFISKEVP
ncbi:MAG: 4Fe-4S ferredoxin iron-sulfur binding domain protein [Myxococcales bacterium]|nr:4Fe-4S ferredoxin iron-sulfur binding domain protein [Myxococcales bacterium]